MSIEKMQRLLLFVMAISLPPVALSYGAAPDVSLPWMFGIDASDVNTRHIFRSIMGLYFGVVILWIMGAFRAPMRLPALWSLVAFTGGIGLGRLLSLMLDGGPHPLLVVYMLLEFLVATTGWLLIKNRLQ